MSKKLLALGSMEHLKKDIHSFPNIAKTSRPPIWALLLWLKRRLMTSFIASFFAIMHQQVVLKHADCCLLLGLDGTHLKSKYQGILLTATAVDAVGSLFPLTFGIVDAENDDNWL